MKNQFFGDINDYRKYGLLQILSYEGKFRVAVCWMLTPNDGSTQGEERSYLDHRDPWENYDIPLYRALAKCPKNRAQRNVRYAEKKKLIPGARYFHDDLTDITSERRSYFHCFFCFAAGADLIFFDPDVGLEIKSTALGKSRRKGSSKYLYKEELTESLKLGFSVLVYQHFPHKDHKDFIEERTQQILEWPGVRRVFSIESENVVFFLLPQSKKHLKDFKESLRKQEKAWRGQMEVN